LTYLVTPWPWPLTFHYETVQTETQLFCYLLVLKWDQSPQ
jgi:hypothetical protein